jgi:hypothetical protein
MIGSASFASPLLSLLSCLLSETVFKRKFTFTVGGRIVISDSSVSSSALCHASKAFGSFVRSPGMTIELQKSLAVVRRILFSTPVDWSRTDIV